MPGLMFMSRKTFQSFLNPVKTLRWYHNLLRSPQPVIVKDWEDLTYLEQKEFEKVEGGRAAAQMWFFCWFGMMPLIAGWGYYAITEEYEHIQQNIEGNIVPHKAYDHMHAHHKDWSFGDGEHSYFFNARTQVMPHSKQHAQHMPGFLGFDKKHWPIWEEGYDRNGVPLDN